MNFVAVFLNKKDNTPLYSQLYIYLRKEILAGRLAAKEKLPSKRAAAQQLGVSVNTVDEAYQMLAAEGYVSAKARSGFVVNRLQQLVPPPVVLPKNMHYLNLREDKPPEKPIFSFASGDIDVSLFPHKMWSRIFKEVLADRSLFDRGEALGDEPLREAIAGYLQGYRGVNCTASEVVLGAGLEVLTAMLVRLFQGSTVAVENPGYPKTAQVLQNEGVSMCAIPIDDEGIDPKTLSESSASIAYLTPSHQFPTGAVMPAGRRTTLLKWAASGKHLLIEDDYNSEFRFDGRPLPSMQGLDNAGRVVYAGTFSRSLAPGLRAAYLVLPPAILARWKAAYGNYACTISRPEQHTLARFMAEGYFSRSLNRMRAAYKQRRNLLIDELHKTLPAGSFQIENTHTGLYFTLRFFEIDALSFAQQARANGIKLRAVDEYYHPNTLPENSTTKNALTLGYGGLSNEEIPAAVHALAKLFFSY